MGFGFGFGAVVLILALLISFPSRGAAGDFLPPFLSPLRNQSCDGVQCGKGTCKVSTSNTVVGFVLGLGFSCECEPGWTKPYKNDDFQFLPCVIPNCTVNYSCLSGAPSPAPEPPRPLSNMSFFDPCLWAICGEGFCVKTSTFSHRCDCKPGYSNLLNITNFPCFQDCVLGADCTELGIGLSNSSIPPTPSGSGITPSGAATAPGMLRLLFILVISLAIF